MEVEHIQKMVEENGKNVGPKDDWMPVLFVEEEKATFIYGLAMGMANEKEKDKVAELLTDIIAKSDAHAIHWLTTVWFVKYTKEESESVDMAKQYPYPRPSQHPLRVEGVCLYSVGIGKENDGEVMSMAEIIRSKNAPKLKPWTTTPGEATAEGRFPDAIRKGFALQKERKYGS